MNHEIEMVWISEIRGAARAVESAAGKVGAAAETVSASALKVAYIQGVRDGFLASLCIPLILFVAWLLRRK